MRAYRATRSCRGRSTGLGEHRPAARAAARRRARRADAPASSTAATRWLTRDAHPHRAAVVEQESSARRGIAVGARGHLVVGERAERAQQVVHAVGAAGAASVGEALQLERDLVDRARVEQVAELLGAEQLAQQVAIERERGGPALGERRIALVHVDRDPAEQQRLRERRRPLGVDRHELRATRAQVGHDLLQRRHVEDVAQALARRFEQHREGRMLRGFDQQVGAALALLPQRRALARTLSGQQQRPRARLAEDAREHRGAGQRLDDRLLELLGLEQQVVDRDAIDRLGKPDHDAVVAPEHLGAGAEPFLEPRLDREPPRRVHPVAEGREHADAPVADLVAEPLDHDRAVVGHGAGGLDLFGEVGDEVVGRPRVEPDLVAQPGERGVAPRAAKLARERADRAPELDRASRLVAVPERHLARLARRGGDHDAVARDVLDAPARRAEQEHLAAARLVHHLLVELADARAVDAGTRRTARGRGSCRRS